MKNPFFYLKSKVELGYLTEIDLIPPKISQASWTAYVS